MKQYIYTTLLSGALAAIAPLAYSADSPTDGLMEVTGSTLSKCVEFYTYQNNLYCTTTAKTDQKPDPELMHYERQYIKFDDRVWELAWGQNDPQVVTVEYIPKGDDINNWHEMITSQYFPGLQAKITPKEMAEKVIAALEKLNFNPVISYMKDTPKQVIFEFRIESPKNQAQDELQMITKGADGLYVLHYAIKEPDMGKENRKKWLANFNQSAIK